MLKKILAYDFQTVPDLGIIIGFALIGLGIYFMGKIIAESFIS